MYGSDVTIQATNWLTDECMPSLVRHALTALRVYHKSDFMHGVDGTCSYDNKYGQQHSSITQVYEHYQDYVYAVDELCDLVHAQYVQDL